jgi:hypothetical protein
MGTLPICTHSVNASGRVKAAIKATGHMALNQSEAYMAAFVAKYGPISIALDDMAQVSHSNHSP